VNQMAGVYFPPFFVFENFVCFSERHDLAVARRTLVDVVLYAVTSSDSL
jgi:hypothetical protein